MINPQYVSSLGVCAQQFDSGDVEPKQNIKKIRIEDNYKIVEIKNESGNKECTPLQYRQLIDSLLKTNSNDDQARNYTCNECQFTSLNKGLARQHAESHWADFRFICKHCGEIFKREMVVQLHVKKTHQLPAEQKRIQESSVTKTKQLSDGRKKRGKYLMNHEKYIQSYKVKRSNEDMTHSDYELLIKSMVERKASREFSCKYCNFTGTDRTHLKEHVEPHLDGFEFICTQCGERTKRTRDMHIHIRKAHVFAGSG